MPSERFPELGYALWNWFRFDNAKAHLAEDGSVALANRRWPIR